MSRLQGSVILLTHAVFPLNVHLFLFSQMCQAIMATMVLTPLFSLGAAELKIVVTVSVVVLLELQEAGESVAQPSQVAALD